MKLFLKVVIKMPLNNFCLFSIIFTVIEFVDLQINFDSCPWKILVVCQQSIYPHPNPLAKGRVSSTNWHEVCGNFDFTFSSAFDPAFGLAFGSAFSSAFGSTHKAWQRLHIVSRPKTTEYHLGAHWVFHSGCQLFLA